MEIQLDVLKINVCNERKATNNESEPVKPRLNNRKMMTTNIFSRFAAKSIFFALLIILTTCKKKVEEIPANLDEFILAPEAKFIDNADWESIVIDVDSTDYTILIDKNASNKYSFKQGDLLVNSVGNGLLRRIESISDSATNLQIRTSQATLTDLIKQGKIDFRAALTTSMIKGIKYNYPGIYMDTKHIKSTGDTIFTWLIDVELAPQIHLQGTFQFNAAFILKVDISILQGLEEIKFGFEGSEDFNLALTAGSQFSLTKEVALFPIHFAPFFIHIPIPPFVLVVVPVMDVKVGINGYANAYITTSLSQQFTLETGFQYLKKSGWSSYMNQDHSFSYSPPQLNLNAGAEAYIKPEVRMMIYNVVGPYINAKGYGRIEADLLQNPWWKLFYGLKMSAGVHAKILNIFIIDFSIGDLLNWEQQVGQAITANLPTVSTNEVINITDTSANGGGNVTSDGGSPVVDRGVCWSISQNPTISESHTSDGSGIGSFISNIIGLIPNTPYYVRAYATNSAGTTYGNQVIFTTLSGGPFGEPCPGIPIITYEGKIYNTVQIGTQCWLKENLNVGTRLEPSQNQNPTNGIKEKYCYDDLESNCDVYGGLYQWDEMMQGTSTSGVQGICPEGWHIPTDEEWTGLGIILGGDSIAGLKMKSITGWYNNGNGTNSSGFTALPGGGPQWGGGYTGIGQYTTFWSSTELSGMDAWGRTLWYFSNGLGQSSGGKIFGNYVRCLKN